MFMVLHAHSRWALVLFLCISYPLSSDAQCDWAAKFASAIQRRYQTNENACKALAAPPAEFDAIHTGLEEEFLRQHYRFINSPELEQWLGSLSDRMLAQFGVPAGRERVRIADARDVNAFSTGQNVVLHAALVNWYLNPESALINAGFSEEQARVYLASLNVPPPGRDGLVGVLAHETSHNILGHPDVRPVVLACEDYIDAGIREVNDYAQLVSTGKKGSRFSALFRATAFIGNEILSGSERQQQFEYDADELGAWLAYRVTGDPNTMLRALQWLAAYPGVAATGGWRDVLCSAHPFLTMRIAKLQVGSLSVASGPPKHLLNLPQDQTRRRYEEFLRWYPARVAAIQRIAAGDLTPEERQQRRLVEVELKPTDAVGMLDGEPFAPGKRKLELSLGPHTLVGDASGVRQEYSFVVLDEGPDKFKLDVKPPHRP